MKRELNVSCFYILLCSVHSLKMLSVGEFDHKVIFISNQVKMSNNLLATDLSNTCGKTSFNLFLGFICTLKIKQSKVFLSLTFPIIYTTIFEAKN